MDLDSETSVYEKLISQCKSNGVASQLALCILTTDPWVDVDVKVDSLTKLQSEIDKGNVKVLPLRQIFHLSISHLLLQGIRPDAVINILKSSLRTSNLHLTNATLSLYPPSSPLISHSTNQAQLTAPPLSSSVSTASVGSSGVLM